MYKKDIMIKRGCTRSLGRLRPRWEDKIELYFKKYMEGRGMNHFGSG
jgi:hypothetical protein